jgi:hypothetical protein
MKINIGSFVIESDSTQFTVYREKVAGKDHKNPGEILKTGPAYYSTFEGALKSLPNRALRESDVTNLYAAVGVIERYHNLITGALKGN